MWILTHDTYYVALQETKGPNCTSFIGIRGTYSDRWHRSTRNHTLYYSPLIQERNP